MLIFPASYSDHQDFNIWPYDVICCVLCDVIVVVLGGECYLFCFRSTDSKLALRFGGGHVLLLRGMGYIHKLEMTLDTVLYCFYHQKIKKYYAVKHIK